MERKGERGMEIESGGRERKEWERIEKRERVRGIERERRIESKGRESEGRMIERKERG